MFHPLCETRLEWHLMGGLGMERDSVVFESDMGIRQAHRMLSAKMVRYSTILVFSFGIKIGGWVVAPTFKLPGPHVHH